MEDYVLEKLKKLRKEKGWTASEAAQQLGFNSQAGYTKIELGNTELKLSFLQTAAKVYGIHISELLGLESNPEYIEFEKVNLKLELSEKEKEILARDNESQAIIIKHLANIYFYSYLISLLESAYLYTESFREKLRVEILNERILYLNLHFEARVDSNKIEKIIESVKTERELDIKEKDKVREMVGLLLSKYKFDKININKIKKPFFKDFNEYVRYKYLIYKDINEQFSISIPSLSSIKNSSDYEMWTTIPKHMYLDGIDKNELRKALDSGPLDQNYLIEINSEITALNTVFDLLKLSEAKQLINFADK